MENQWTRHPHFKRVMAAAALREIEVVRMRREGTQVKVVARQLGVSPSRVQAMCRRAALRAAEANHAMAGE